MDISKILVPVDFSDVSEKAFDYALNFGEHYGSEISILHSLVIYQDMHEEIVNFKDFQKFIEIRETKAEDKLRKYVEKASAHGADVESIIVKGLSAADSISQYLSENEFDLVIMGRRGLSSSEQAALGSVTEAIIRLSPAPVLTIPGNIENKAFKKILVPIDFSIHSARSLDYTASLAEKFGAKVILLHVVEQGIYPSFYSVDVSSVFEIDPTLKEEIIFNMQEFSKDHIEDVFIEDFIVEEGKPHKKIVEFAEFHPVDLIVISTHGLEGLDYVMLGATAEKVARWAGCPSLLVKRS